MSAPRSSRDPRPPDRPPSEASNTPDKAGPNGNLVGLITTGALHLALFVAVIASSFKFCKKETHAQPKERIIQASVLIQAGSAEGRRTHGQAFKRPENTRQRRVQQSKRYRYGASDNRLPKNGRISRRSTPDDKDDAIDAPGLGSQTGVKAPPGAKPSADRKGAGGDSEKGALDPCFSQHDAVVATYKGKIRKKIPRFKRPAFVSAEVAKNLTTVVRVYIGGAGNIIRVTTARSSGNPRYDGAAVAHVKAIGKFPAPHKCVMYDKRRAKFRTSISVGVVIRSR